MAREPRSEEESWQRIWSRREELLKVARRRSVSLEDAEDAVHEAMLRAMERPGLDEERLGAWLTTVTVRLCVDRHRQVRREAEVGSRATSAVVQATPVEEAVCDRDEADWLARRSGQLPGRQAEALRLKSENLDVGQVARRMGLSYRTVESLLARARRTLRESLAGTLALVVWLVWRGRPRTGGVVQAATVVSSAATLACLGMVVPPSYDEAWPQPPHRAPEARVERPPAGYALPVQGSGRGAAQASPRARKPAVPRHDGLRAPEMLSGVADSLTTLDVPAAPKAPKVPEVPDARHVPDAEVPDAEVPDVEVPDVEVPDAEVPAAEVPDPPDLPGEPAPPSAPGGGDAPRPALPEAPEAPLPGTP